MRKDDLLIYSAVLIYIALVQLFHFFNGTYNYMRVYFYSELLALIAILISFIFLAIRIFQGKARDYLNRDYVISFALIIALSNGFKTTFASHKQTIPVLNPFCWDSALSRLDYFIHFNHYPHQFIEFMLNYPSVVKFIDLNYMIWFLILILSCILSAWSIRRILRLQFILSTLLVWIVLGSVFGTVFSSVGPCYYDKYVSGPNPYASLMERLYEINNLSKLWAIKNQIGIWQNHISGGWLPFGGISAMPSIHVAMAVIFALASWKLNKKIGLVFGAYALVIQTGSVLLGWHYAVDGYFAAILTIFIWVMIGKLGCKFLNSVERS